MKTPAFPRPSAAARFALTLLALAVAAAPASSQTRGQRAYSPNNPLDMAQRELDKAETEAVRFDPQSPERKAVEGRAQQLRAQIAGSVLIYGAGINKPGLYPATPGLTLTEALKLAGGTTPDAEPAAQLAFASPHQGNLSGIRVNLSGRLEPEPPYDPATVPRRGQPGAGFGPPSAEYNYTISTGDSIRVDAT
jgi:protein involved in polysaccharide export with SLBB domain